MAALSHELRAIDEFLEAHAAQQQLTDEGRSRLRERLLALVEWLKTFRRSLHFAQRYPPRHPSRAEALEQIVTATKAYLREYGALTLQFGPGTSRTPDGFELPYAQDEDLRKYTFYPFFRDGVVELQLKPGITPIELDTILEICATGGRREDDDVVTWLWTGRFQKVRMEVEPALSPRIAAALAVQAPEDDVLDYYLAALEGAGPFWSGYDGRAAFTVEHAPQLASQGLDEAAVRDCLFGDAAHKFDGVPTDAVRAWREAYNDHDDRRERLLGAGRAGGVTGGA